MALRVLDGVKNVRFVLADLLEEGGNLTLANQLRACEGPRAKVEFGIELLPFRECLLLGCDIVQQCHTEGRRWYWNVDGIALIRRWSVLSTREDLADARTALWRISYPGKHNLYRLLGTAAGNGYEAAALDKGNEEDRGALIYFTHEIRADVRRITQIASPVVAPNESRQQSKRVSSSKWATWKLKRVRSYLSDVIQHETSLTQLQD